ncbi:MAG: hypothetical protein QXS42_05525 [Zestosphaera sp.]
MSNLLTILLGPSIYALAIVAFTLLTVCNLTFYGIYKGVNPTFIPAGLTAATLVYLIVEFLSLPDFIVEIPLLAVLLMLASLHWDSLGVRGSFSYATPPALLAGVLIGIWVGLGTPLRFCLASMIETTYYRLLREYYRLGGFALCLTSLLFIAIYVSPLLSINVSFLAFSLLLYVCKAYLFERGLSNATHIADLDVFLKPLAAGWLA